MGPSLDGNNSILGIDELEFVVEPQVGTGTVEDTSVTDNGKGQSVQGEEQGKAPSNTPKRRRFKARYAVFSAIIAVALAFIASTFFITIVEVRGTSMQPSMKSGSYAIILNGNKFSKGDVAAFNRDNKIIMKRVAGTEGDSVNVIKSGSATADGVSQDNEYTTLAATASVNDDASGGLDYPYTVEEKSYFILGDDRSDVSDSRNEALGTFNESEAIGRVLFCI